MSVHTGFTVMSYLSKLNTNFVFGVVWEDESVIAFGTKNPNGTKNRVGSISIQEEGIGYEFLVLSMDNTNEFRATDINQLYWFLWSLATHKKGWDFSECWVREK